MSDTEDDMAAGAQLYEQSRENPTWTTRDGKNIPVTKMSDSHLVNTIRLIERTTQGPALRHAIFHLSTLEMLFDSDVATDDLDNQMMVLESEDGWKTLLPEIYHAMVDEVVARGLEL